MKFRIIEAPPLVLIVVWFSFCFGLFFVVLGICALLETYFPNVWYLIQRW